MKAETLGMDSAASERLVNSDSVFATRVLDPAANPDSWLLEGEGTCPVCTCQNGAKSLRQAGSARWSAQREAGRRLVLRM